MQANYINQPMSNEKLEQLEAFAKMMIVSFVWQTSGLMEQPSKIKQDTTKQSQTNPETKYSEKK
ncbi:hypothetical protein ACP6PL_00200 [Dapis sp. BLCC M126]|uniref:hypothetical protein n=1 Tax=Dapis sp. BLCC M126 TaxID=3400189 RepID=UPI003CED968B